MATCQRLTFGTFFLVVCLLTISEARKSKWYSGKALTNLTSLGLFDQMWNQDLKPILIPRISGTEGNRIVRQHIINRLTALEMWKIELDEFHEKTPDGKVKFATIVATLNPLAPKRVILACHYDSKKFPFEFISATDSAVPCALLLALARELKCLLQNRKENLETTLQLVFFDGEESVREWRENDSLYGSRHLASKWQKSIKPNGRSELYSITDFILLDLIGGPKMKFHNFFPLETSQLFEILSKIEDSLLRRNLLHRDPTGRYETMFSQTLLNMPFGGIQDDHLPFYKKGVKVLHLICYPFPDVWHKATDTEDNLDKRSIANFKQVFTVFVAYYLNLDSWLNECSGTQSK